jgi:hypothetical protein
LLAGETLHLMVGMDASPRFAVILVGLAYYPARSPSDKTFMRDVARSAMLDHGLDVRIVSIAETRRWAASPPELTDEKPLPLYVPRPLHSATATRGGSLAHPEHGMVREYVERTATALALAPVLMLLRAQSAARCVHFFDNLGPAAGLAARRAGLRSGMTLQSSNSALARPIRRVFWRTSCIGMDDVVTGSRDLAEELILSGVHVGAVIPWGPARRPGRQMLPREDRCLVVWTGRLGSSGINELRLAASAIRLAARVLPQIVGEVWPKPEYEYEYSAVARQHALTVRVPGHAFTDALEKVRVLVSPVPDPECIVGPPLTWLEAIAGGATVVTTPCRGLPTEAVASGAIVVARERSIKALRDAVLEAWSQTSASRWHTGTAREAAAKYVELWSRTP